MNIAIVSVFDVSLLEGFVYHEYRERIRRLNSNFTPAVAALTLELLRKGENVIVFTLDVKADGVEEFHGERVSVYVAPAIPRIKKIFTFGMSTAIEVSKLFRLHKGKIDVVSAHWTRDYAIAAKAFIGKAPVFVTVRDILPYILTQIKSNRLRWRWIWLQNEYVLRSKGYRYIANSAYTAHEVERYWGHRIPVVPNSVDLEGIPVESSHTLPTTDGNFFVTSISLSDFSDRRKNADTLLKAFSTFRKAYPRAVLNLVGPYFTENNPLTKDYRRKGLMEGVRLMGRQSPEQVRLILSESTMMVHPSLEETFGNTLIEALACGVPVVGGINSGAVPWVLEHGRLGYLCDVSSAIAITDTMLHIARNYDEASTKAEIGKQTCLTTYSVSNVADEYLRIFRESLTGTLES